MFSDNFYNSSITISRNQRFTKKITCSKQLVDLLPKTSTCQLFKYFQYLSPYWRWQRRQRGAYRDGTAKKYKKQKVYKTNKSNKSSKSRKK